MALLAQLLRAVAVPALVFSVVSYTGIPADERDAWDAFFVRHLGIAVS